MSAETNQRMQNKGWSPGLVIKGVDLNQMVVSSNPGAGYWMDIFSHLFVVRNVMFV